MDRIITKLKNAGLSPDHEYILTYVYNSYVTAVKEKGLSKEAVEPILLTLLDRIFEEAKSPHIFKLYHERELSPFNYYQFGLDFFSNLIKLEESTVVGLDHFDEVDKKIKKGENVILFSNHQTEPDPQIISLLLKKTHPQLEQDMIIVAGHRVVTDPFAIPFSRGRNLLCIYSKRYIEHPPEEKEVKIKHNQLTLNKMKELLEEGGKCIYVAPSGGRDRKNELGRVEVTPLDVNAPELFKLISDQISKKTNFYPLALSTYDLFPPPKGIQTKVGEIRDAKACAVHIALGSQINMETYPGSEIKEKKARREARAKYIWNLINTEYQKIYV